MIKSITIRRPDDFHVHLRDGELLKTTVPHVAGQFSRAIIMPNLKPPITTTKQAVEYKERILKALPQDLAFTPLMTLYLTDHFSIQEVMAAKSSGIVHGMKLYPAGATTFSERGIQNISRLYPVFEAMQKHHLPLLVHGESTRKGIDIFDREKAFIDESLEPLTRQFSHLKVVFEHITTEDAVEFVSASSPRIAATITAHHLRYNRNDLFYGGIHPHLYCLPLLNHASHQKALLLAATSGNPKFFLGSDSAPHAQSEKESACGPAGIYTAHAALELYAEVFEQEGALDKLEAFSSQHGALFYGLPLNQETITLVKEPHPIPESFPFGTEKLVPLSANEQVLWRLKE